MEAPDILQLIGKFKEYGIGGFGVFLSLRYGGTILTFVLQRLNIRLTRRQSVDDQLTAVRGEIATIRAAFNSMADLVVDAAQAIEDELSQPVPNLRVVRIFLNRLKNVKRLPPGPLQELAVSPSLAPISPQSTFPSDEPPTPETPSNAG